MRDRARGLGLRLVRGRELVKQSYTAAEAKRDELKEQREARRAAHRRRWADSSLSDAQAGATLSAMVSRRLIGFVAIGTAGFAAAAILLPRSPSGLRELLLSVGPAAPVIALGAWIVLTPALFPGTLLAAAGGVAFGALGGSVLAVAGALTGGLAAFALARTAARGGVEQAVRRQPRLARVHALLERRGFAAILAARLMPGVPAGGLHYVAGASPVSVRSFAAAIAIGAVLRTVPYAVLGQGLGSGSIATTLVAAGSVALGSLVAALLVRQIRRPSAAA